MQLGSVKKIVLLLFGLLLIIRCNQDNTTDTKERGTSDTYEILFEKIPSSTSGVTFNNQIRENSKIHPFVWNFMYQGAGVAVGDINNDGLPDIYFSGNMVSDKLYLNKGNFVFEDISTTAGIEDKFWSTGVNMVDVNADGLLDIYVCKNFFLPQPGVRRNKLFINNGDATFTEKGEEYGLADTGFSIQSNFFDADNDGDLDMYLVNQPVDVYSGLMMRLETVKGLPSSDKFYENRNGKFYDVTKELNLTNKSYGLNSLVADLNADGWSDLYICNDYNKGDQMLMNQGGGKYLNEILDRTKHTSFYSMGSDAADVNRDGHIDFITLDMAFSSHYRSKTNMESMRPELFWNLRNDGQQFQYAVNNLQVNNGDGTFKDVAHYSGVSHTDWSWSPLFVDLDSDGHKDLLVSNGILKDLRNNDFMTAFKNHQIPKITPQNVQQVISRIPSTVVANLAYKNTGKLKFENVSASSGFGEQGFSSGMAYADFDNDGDMDVVINNTNAEASILRNNSKQGHYLKVKLQGKDENKNGIGATIKLYCPSHTEVMDVTPVRGYMSCSENVVHFGLGKTEKVDSVVVLWDHKSKTIVKNPKIDQLLTVEQSETTARTKEEKIIKNKNSDFNFAHKENEFDDYKSQVLLPHQLSRGGPYISSTESGDIYISGARNQKGQFILGDGTLNSTSNKEELDHVFFDVDNDDDLDLYIVSGGHEYPTDAVENQDQLFINNGSGKYSPYPHDLSMTHIDGSCVVNADFNGDGWQDIFIGGRSLPGRYPHPAVSKLLLNDNGIFKDASEDWSKDLNALGMVTDAIADDYDNDGDQDLIIVGEWMPITILENEGNKFTKKTISTFDHESNGWWWHINKGDFDGDGDNDLIVGNLGLNNKFKASTQKPFNIYSDDFDSNGDHDVVLAKKINDAYYPVRGRECSTEEMPFVSEKFKNYDAFAKASLIEIIPQDKLDNSVHYSIKSFESIYLENVDGKYVAKKLPYQTQLGPIKATIPYDYNKDGHLDFIFAGNHYPVEVETVRYDASIGGVCLGDGKGNFTFLPFTESGLKFDCDARDLEIIKKDGKKYVLCACNNDKLIQYEID